MATNAIKYLSNVGKSIMYSSVDVIKNANPAITGFADTNADVLKSSYTAITHLKQTVDKSKTSIMESRYDQIGKKAINNIYSDLQTGKFYNKERIDKTESEAAAKWMSDMDFDIEVDMGEESFGMDAESTKATLEMMDNVGEKTSTAISAVVARSAEYVVNSNAQMNRAIYEQNKAIFSHLHTGMNTINSNLSTLVKLASGPMQTHFSNSTTFYETQTKLIQDQNSILKEILEIQKELYQPDKSVSSGNKKITMSDILDSNGMPNLEKYFNRIKQNAKNMGSGAGAMIDFMFDSGAIESLIASPLQGVTNLVAKKLIPNILTSAMEEFNKSLSGFFPAMIAKLNNSNSTNPMMGLLKNIFGIEDLKFEGINTSDYEKGRVPFDGITRKSIIEVIPTYLAQIASAVTGRPEQRYDYHSGKFISTAKIAKSLSDMENSAHKNASFDIEKYVTDMTYYMGMSKEDNAQFKKDLEAILRKSFKDGMLFNPNSKNANAKYYGLKGGKRSDVNIEIIAEIFRQMPNSMKMQWYPQMFNAKDQHYEKMSKLNESGDSIFAALFNDSIQKSEKGSSSKTTDATLSPKNVLINIHNEVKMIREAILADLPKELDTKLKNSGYRNYKKMERMTLDTYLANVKRISPEELALKQKLWEKAKGSKTATVDSAKTKQTAKEMVKKAKKKKEESDNIINSTLFDQFMESDLASDKFKTVVNGMRGLANTPVRSIANIVKAADNALYTAIFGLDTDSSEDKLMKQKGILGTMHQGLKDTFSDFKHWLDDNILIPITRFFNKDLFKEKYDQVMEGLGLDPKSSAERFKTKLFGVRDEFGNRIQDGTFSDFTDRFGATMRRAGGYVRDVAREPLDKLEITKKKNSKGIEKDRINKLLYKALRETGADSGVADIDNAATGIKRVAKTGVVAVSEGEMIIPASLNPYNVSKNIKAENKAKSKFAKTFGISSDIPGYATGTNNVDFDEKSTKSVERIRKMISEGKSDKLISLINKLPKDKKDKFRQLLKNAVQDLDKSDYEDGRDKNILGKSIEELASGTKAVANYMKGLIPESKDDANKEKKSIMSTAFNEMKKYFPEMAAGGVIGGGVSLLTGAIGGPLLGAAVGAGISLLKHSENVRNIVFGEKTEEGRKDGLLPAKVVDILEKYAPSMTKGGILGAITSMIPGIPGGPVAGIIFGSAIGFASENDKVKEVLFGTESKKGLLPKDMVERVKKILPKMGAGALAGTLIGPFGLTTNLILGSAIGLATETDTFKDIIFGKKGEDGKRSGGWIQKTLDATLGRLKNAADPLKKQFELMAKGTIDFFKHQLEKLLKDHLGAPLDKFMKSITDPVKKLFGGFIKGMLSPITGLVTFPFKAIEGLGNAARKRQIARGQDNYDTAEQRLLFRKKRRRKLDLFDPRAQRFERYDNEMVDMSSDQISSALNVLREIQGVDKGIDDPGILEGLRNQFRVNVQENSNLNYRQTDKIGKYMYEAMSSSKSADEMSEKISKYVAGLDLSEEDRKVITNSSNKLLAGIRERENRRESFNKNKGDIFKKIRHFGIDIENEDDVPNLIKLLERQLTAQQEKEEKYAMEHPVEKQTEQEKLQHDETIKHVKSIEDRLIEIINVIKESNREIITENRVSDIIDDYDGVSKDIDGRLISRLKRGRRPAIRAIKANIKDTNELRKAARDARNEANTGFMNVVFGNKTIDHKDTDNYDIYTGEKLSTEARDRYARLKAKRRSSTVLTTIPNAASGTDMVEQSGLAAVSEGESIVSAKLNPSNVNAEAVLEKNTMLERAKKTAKRGKDAVYTFVKGLPVRYIKDKTGKLSLDKSDGDTARTLDKIEADDKQQSGIWSTISGFANGMKNNLKTLLGIGEEEDEGGNLFTKLLGKVGLSAGVAIGLPLFTGIWTKDIWPKIQPVFENIFPNLSVDIGNIMNTAIDRITDWLTGTGASAGKGLPMVMDYLVNRWGAGFSLIMEKVVPKAAEIIITALPSIFKGVVTGIGKVLGTTITSILGKNNDTSPEDVSNEVFADAPSTNSVLTALSNSGTAVRPLMESTTFPDLSNWSIDSSAVSTAMTYKTSSSRLIPNGGTGSYDMISEKAYAIAAATGEDPRNINIDDYGVTSQGTIYKKISDTERDANSEKYVHRTTLGEGLASTSGKAFLKGSSYKTVLGKTGKTMSKVPNSIFKVLGGGLQAADDVITSAGKLGSKVLPSNTIFGMNHANAATSGSKFGNFVSNTKKGISDFVTGRDIVRTNNVIGATGPSVADNIYETTTRSKALRQGLTEGVDFTVTNKTATSKIASKASATASKVISAVDNSIFGKVKTHITSAISKLFSNGTVIGKFGSVIKSLGTSMTKEAAEKAAKEFGEKVSSKLISVVGETLAKSAGKASAKLAAGAMTAGIINVAFGVAAFIKGYNNPNDYLSVANAVSDPSLFARLASGVVAALNEFCCLGLLPISTIVDIALPTLQSIPAFSKFATSIIEDRESSNELVAEFNAEQGTNLSVEEYNKVTKNKKRNGIVASIIGQKAYVDDDGNYVKAKDGIVQKTGKAIFGNKETGQKSIIGNFTQSAKASWQWAIGKSNENASSIANKVDSDDPNSFMLKLTSKATDIALTPVYGIVNIGKHIWNAAQPVFNAASSMLKQFGSDAIDGVKDLWRGDIKGFLSVNEDNENNPLSPYRTLLKAASRLIVSPISGFIYAGGKLKNAVVSVAKGAARVIPNVISSEGRLISNSFSGNSKFADLFNLSYENDGDGPTGWVSVALRAISRTVTAPVAGIGMIGSKISDVLKPLVESGKTSISYITSEASRIFDYMEKESLEGYWDNSTKINTNNVFDLTAGVLNLVMRTVMFPVVAVKQMINSISSGVSDAISGIKSGWEKFTSWFFGENTSDTSSNTSTSNSSSTSAYSSTNTNGLRTSTRAGGFGSGLFHGRGFVSQRDPAYSDISMGNETFSQAGCAPASAYMVTDGTEKESDGLKEAAAIARKYQSVNGVSSEYFGHYFKKKGLSSKYISNSGDITTSLLNGNQVVLGGQDATNTSKAKSPFGPGGHYVVANGITEDGKYMQINDPEASEPNKLYPSREILKSTKVGIAAGKGTGILFKGKGSVFYGGASDLPGSSIAEKCWNYLRSCGFSDAAAAGVLGNLKAESGVDPTKLQNGRGPAAGICQWETYGKSGTRWGRMAALAKSKGRAWTDLESQLQFMISELPSNFKSYTGKVHTYSNGTKTWWPTKMTLDDFKKLSDVAKATEIFERVFERPSIPHRERRIKYAQEFYNKFSGKYTPVTGISSSGSGGSSDSSSTGGSVLDQLLGSWDSLGAAYGLTGTSDTTTSVAGTGGAGNATQQELVKKMQSVEGKLKYSMTGPRDPDKGSADCSSTVNWAYKKVTGIDVGNSTPAMYNNKNTTTVDTGTGAKSSKPDESKLQPGDLLLFWREWSKNRAPAGVGHVEMYIGNGKQIGHGGGIGPKTKTLQGNFLRARRLNKFMGKGSEIDGIAPSSGNTIIRYGKGSSATNSTLSASMLYTDTSDVTKAPTTSSVVKSSNSSSSGYSLLPMGGSASSADTSQVTYTAELMNIVTLLTRVVDNTSLLQSIVSVLTKVLEIMNEEVEAKKANNSNKLEQLQRKKQNLFASLGNLSANSGNDQIALLIKNAEKLAKA